MTPYDLEISPEQQLKNIESSFDDDESEDIDIYEEWEDKKVILERNKALLRKIDKSINKKLDNWEHLPMRDLISAKDSAAKQIAIIEWDNPDPTGWPKYIPAVINILVKNA